MKWDNLSLARQLDFVFRSLDEELSGLSSGVIVVQIRSNSIGKFGIKHDLLQVREGRTGPNDQGLTVEQRQELRSMALRALKHKKGWTHGEIQYEFTVRNRMLIADVQMESNYNTSVMFSRITGIL